MGKDWRGLLVGIGGKKFLLPSYGLFLNWVVLPRRSLRKKEGPISGFWPRKEEGRLRIITWFWIGLGFPLRVKRG